MSLFISVIPNILLKVSIFKSSSRVVYDRTCFGRYLVGNE